MVATPPARVSEIIPSCFLAGCGMAFAGSLLDQIKSQYTQEFDPRLLAVIPPLIGLKGNLEVALSSRLATVANLKSEASCYTIHLFLMALLYILLQGVCAAFAISVLCWGLHTSFSVTNSQLNLIHLTTISLLTCTITICTLSFLVFLVILGCLKFGVNPDNVAPPVAAALGDLGTVVVLLVVNRFAIDLPETAMFFAFFLFVSIVGTSIYYLGFNSDGYSNDFQSLSITPRTLLSSIAPLLMAVTMSSLSGQILAQFSHISNLARLQIAINGVGGCFGSIIVSRMLTGIHARNLHKTYTSPLCRKSSTESTDSTSTSISDHRLPQSERSTCSSHAPNERAVMEIRKEADIVSRLILFSCIPIHLTLALVSLMLMRLFGEGSQDYLPGDLFTVRTACSYALAGFLQVFIVLRFAKWIVLTSWHYVTCSGHQLPWLACIRSPKVAEPSLAALDLTGVALTTGLGDLLGSVLLTLSLHCFQTT